MLVERSLRVFFARVVGNVSTTATCSACLVADPPQYEEPERTPPFLDLVAATPALNQVIVRDLNVSSTIQFDIPLRSEDNGDPIFYALHGDYKFDDNAAHLSQGEVSPSTFDDTSRSVSFSWTFNGFDRDGCHLLTLLVAHRSSWDYAKSRPKPIEGIGDTAMATWWFNQNPEPDAPNSLQDCPTASEIER